MKIRNGFVSNSSSSSFVINKQELTNGQIEAIRNHSQYASIVDKHYRAMVKELIESGFDVCEIDYELSQMINDEEYSLFDFIDKWDVKENLFEIIVSCTIDNFNMRKFLEFIKVSSDDFKEVPY